MRASDRYKLQMWNKVKRELNKKGKVLRRNKREREKAALLASEFVFNR